MENAVNSQIGAEPKKQKKGRGKKFLIFVLLLLVFGLGGYIVYDKFLIKEKIKTDKTVTTKVKEEKKVDNSLANEMALGLGQYLYKYATKNLFNICAVGDQGGMVYNNGNINVVDNNYVYKNGDVSASLIYQDKIDLLTSNALENFKKQKGITLVGNNYYIVGDFGDCYQGWIEDYSEIALSNISDNKVEYNVTEYYCKDLENCDKCDKKDGECVNEIKSVFVISKIDNQWKISQYEDSYQKNIS